MRFVVLSLICLLILASRPVTITATPATYRSTVAFENTLADGPSTTVSILVDKEPGSTIIALSIHRFRPLCVNAPCGNAVLFASARTEAIQPADALIDQHLGWASLHTTLPLVDQQSNAPEVVTIDVEWTAAGRLTPVPYGIDQAYERPATARGMVTSRSLGAVPLQSTRPGAISRQLES